MISGPARTSAILVPVMLGKVAKFLESVKDIAICGDLEVAVIFATFSRKDTGIIGKILSIEEVPWLNRG